MSKNEVSAIDVAGPFVDEIPDSLEERSRMDRLAYTSPQELLDEKFHMHFDILRTLNPDADFSEPGTVIVVAAINDDPLGNPRGVLGGLKYRSPDDRSADTVVRIEVDKENEQLRGYDGGGELIVAYPATIGSAENPSPSGMRKVVVVVTNPEYWYTPHLGIDGPDEALRLPPGPNGPVGSIWIDLDEDGYGIHGTPEPAKIRRQQSHGCVRLTNWDAEELADLVEEGTTVEFLESASLENDR